MGSSYQSDSMLRARDVCKGIYNGKILHFSCYYKYGVLFFGDDRTGPANEYQSVSGDGLVKIWKGAFIICNTITL